MTMHKIRRNMAIIGLLMSIVALVSQGTTSRAPMAWVVIDDWVVVLCLTYVMPGLIPVGMVECIFNYKPFEHGRDGSLTMALSILIATFFWFAPASLIEKWQRAISARLSPILTPWWKRAEMEVDALKAEFIRLFQSRPSEGRREGDL